MKKFDNDVREFIASQVENVQLDGLCPICGTGRSQNGECWHGHIVIDVRRPTKRALDGAYICANCGHAANIKHCGTCGIDNPPRQ